MLLDEAKSFIQTMFNELNYSSSETQQRLNEIEEEIKETGSYTHTYEELVYGSKMAWRNSNRCIGRLFWESLNVEDARHVENEEEFIDTIHQHINKATNNGKIKPLITIYSPKMAQKYIIISLFVMQVMTKQEIHLRKVTRLAQHLGWSSEGTDFDILPLIYQMPNEALKFHEYPKHLIKEVPIFHDQYPKLAHLNLKWYAVPIISNMDLKLAESFILLHRLMDGIW